jgi:DNA polymerase-3 subunit epsilon
MRQVILDTETTGLDPAEGHRLVEIGCIELVNRRPTGRTFHRYLNPERDIDEGALAVHGITRAQLETEAKFDAVAAELLEFIGGAELVIHNAAFDVGFLNAELARLAEGQDVGGGGGGGGGGGEGGGPRRIETFCRVLDTLALARSMHPGQRNSLDALCKRYGVDNSKRELHGAMLDARILVDVYLAMTGGQSALALGETQAQRDALASVVRTPRVGLALKVVAASAEEMSAHETMLAALDKASGGKCLFRVA